eukprot:4519973-Amphidinium_carterae.1
MDRPALHSTNSIHQNSAMYQNAFAKGAAPQTQNESLDACPHPAALPHVIPRQKKQMPGMKLLEVMMPQSERFMTQEPTTHNQLMRSKLLVLNTRYSYAEFSIPNEQSTPLCENTSPSHRKNNDKQIKQYRHV